MALPDAGMDFVCLARRGNGSKSCAAPRALHLASAVLFGGTMCPKGSERASRQQH